MNVLHILGSLDQRSGGPLRAVLDLSAMCAPLGLHSEILGLGPVRIPDNPIAPELIHSLPVQAFGSYGYAPTLRQWCRANLARFDVVMLHGLWMYPNWAVSRECINAGIPYIAFPHGMLDLWSVHGQGFLKRLKKTVYWHWRERKVIASSIAVFFTMGRELSNATQTFKLPECAKLVVSPYGTALPISSFATEPSAKVCQGQELRIALFLGRVHPKKRPDLLIRAWQAAGVGPEWKLVIAGSGEQTYVDSLKLLVRQLKLDGAVEFVGAVAGVDKQYILRRASWFLLPSEQENFGIAVIEAIQAGCAIAISDQVYLGDEFPEGSEILPVQVEAWSKFMRERMQDVNWQHHQGQQVANMLLPQYDHDRVAKNWKNAIEAAVDRPTLVDS